MSGKSYNRPLEHKEYLKLKYLTPNDGKDDKKKRIKIKKSLKPKNKKIRIFDDDIDLKNIDANASDEDLYFGTNEEKPIIAEVVDERPLHMRRKDIDRNRWKAIDSNVDETDKRSNERLRHDSDSDLSPIRTTKKTRPVGKDLSPKRRRRHDSDSDLSPVRTKDTKKRDSSVGSRHRDNKKDKDLSPKRRRHDSDSDLSPVRSVETTKRSISHKDNDLSPKRRRDSDSDLSPQRETNGRHKTSDIRHKTSLDNKTSESRHNSDSDLSPPRGQSDDKKPKKRELTLGGKKAGLSDGKFLREELMATKRKEQKLFESISDEMLGKNAKTVFRDSKSGRIRDLEEEAKLEFEKNLIKDKIEAQKKAKYEKWSKGVVQTQQRQEKRESDRHEMSKPLARYEGDVDLDKMLREKEREDDPMAAMIRKNKDEEKLIDGTVKVKPKYKGPAPPLNRFNIYPGYRWDGVDRSNGFEKKHFDRIANKESTLEEAYRWSTQDIGPTDILRALADVTQRDFSGPDYRYIDDPFLTPLSNHQKRLFSLSRESGRRAAKYVFEEFPELFFRDVSEPKIEAFTYKEVYDENTEVDETDLKKCIARKEVNHSMVCYKNMTRDAKEISGQTVQKLLELVCFYNCEEPVDMEFIIEKSFSKESERLLVVWKDNGFAEQLFDSIAEKTSETYCALIQGLAKHSQSQKAYQYYREMIEKGLKLNTETYNSLIKVAPMLRESSDTRWVYVEEILNCMKSNAIKPNLQTLNNMLEVITRFGAMRFTQNFAKKTLVEMTVNLGVEPSLATYYHLLNIFSRDKSPTSHVLYEIMDKIDGKEFVIRDPKDVNFFLTAMSVCQRLGDISLAYRLHELVSKGNNSRLLGNILNESTYYQKFFRLLTTSEDIKVFMEFYEKYVPHVYIPEPVVLSDIWRMIQLYDGYHYLPRIWEDFKNFEYMSQINLMEEFLGLISIAKVNEDLQKQFTAIVNESLKFIDSRLDHQLQEGHVVVHQFTGVLLGYAIDIYLNANDMESAQSVLNKLTQTKKVTGNPSDQTLGRFCIKAIDAKKYAFAKQCIEFGLELGMTEMVAHVKQHITESPDMDPNIKALLVETCGKGEVVSEEETRESPIDDNPIDNKSSF
ncbi:unnamed protein product [Oppiella nova]|uniref:Small ribosomal subunit protein mS39 n=1 Tax=Oppiella nova TaxID=334625 RepID=A0A7R9LF51_9ACAR|nr:unnamed protein product [Oppiella nova]CAG2162312.1 unnamed protein product [Oppiella nova]